MTLLEKILLGTIAGSVLSFIIAARLGRWLHRVDEDAKPDMENYRRHHR
jgi:hypothetical protein